MRDLESRYRVCCHFGASERCNLIHSNTLREEKKKKKKKKLVLRPGHRATLSNPVATLWPFLPQYLPFSLHFHPSSFHPPPFLSSLLPSALQQVSQSTASAYLYQSSPACRPVLSRCHPRPLSYVRSAYATENRSVMQVPSSFGFIRVYDCGFHCGTAYCLNGSGRA